jgi:pimeloyl-ACP methyl ester carboxylesterase
VLMLNHWGAVLDNFDPRIVDGFAATRPVIALDYRGVGASTGRVRLTVAEMITSSEKASALLVGMP